ncbi:hypothetical protein [Candidatus Poriferisodalis sp.]|uniref:hypothetical protein n=1 Tax=Candidatus Poriferisodalis sp. TaxID=3101277 RepID=UPI003AF82317
MTTGPGEADVRQRNPNIWPDSMMEQVVLADAVERGADTDAILTELGRTPETIAELRAAGIVLERPRQ